MEKRIFIKDDNMIKACDISIVDDEIFGIIKEFNKKSKLADFSLMLITMENPIDISRVIRRISEYQPSSNLEKRIKDRLIDSIIINDTDFTSILYSEDKKCMNMLCLIKNKIKEKHGNNNYINNDDIVYSVLFDEAILDKIIQIELINYEAFIFEKQLDDILFSSTQIKEYKKRVVKNLPYTKKRR